MLWLLMNLPHAERSVISSAEECFHGEGFWYEGCLSKIVANNFWNCCGSALFLDTFDCCQGMRHVFEEWPLGLSL